MRLNEIEKELKVRSGPGLRASQKKALAVPGAEKLGSGFYGKTYTVPGDVEKVVKYSRLQGRSWDDDGYYRYVTGLRDAKRVSRNNPFLPQIYSVKRLKSPRGIPYLETVMEKLYSFDSLSDDQAKDVLEKLAGEHLSTEIKPFGNWKKTLVDVVKQFVVFPDNEVEVEDKTFYINNKEFINAVVILLKYSADFKPDIHGGNLMFRMTPTGPQLVLSDPLSKRGALQLP